MAGDLLEFSNIVAQENVGDLMRDVAVCAAGVVERVVHDDGSAVRQVEGRGG